MIKFFALPTLAVKRRTPRLWLNFGSTLEKRQRSHMGKLQRRDANLVVQFIGDDKFFIGSDYPHAEGFVDPVAKAREHLAMFTGGFGGQDSKYECARFLWDMKLQLRLVALPHKARSKSGLRG